MYGILMILFGVHYLQGAVLFSVVAIVSGGIVILRSLYNAILMKKEINVMNNAIESDSGKMVSEV
jgi:hypothetical protein